MLGIYKNFLIIITIFAFLIMPASTEAGFFDNIASFILGIFASTEETPINVEFPINEEVPIDEEIPICEDSDGGKNYYIKGTIITNGISKTDYCTTGSWGNNIANLIEYYCLDDEIRASYGYDCPQGCKNGACLSQPEDPPIDDNKPDLTVTKLEITKQEPDYVKISYCFKNIDNVESGMFSTELDNLDNPTWDFDKNKWNSLESNQEHCTWTRRSGVNHNGGNGYVRGENRIKLMVDSNGVVQESDEKNNTSIAIFDTAEFLPTCSDGTHWRKCSHMQPIYCDNGNLINKASICGCPDGMVVDGEDCEEESCSCGAWTSQGCGKGHYCDMDQELFTRECENDCDIESECRVVDAKCEIEASYPIPDNAHCFWQKNRDESECSQYYIQECDQCPKTLACPKYFNPVYDSDGIFYPSACWAEQLGALNYNYGYSDKFMQFIKDIWLFLGYEVPLPDIEFSYQGDGAHAGFKKGTWIRSVLWKDALNYLVADFNIETTSDAPLTISSSERQTRAPVVNNIQKTLLTFVMFDNAYPKEILLEWTPIYTNLINNYIKKKQEVPNPLYYDVMSVVIDPPEETEEDPTDRFTNKELQAFYDASIAQIEEQDFEVFIVVPISLNGLYGGYYSWWNNMELMVSLLAPPNNYSSIDKKLGLNSLAAFQHMSGTISHEILHAAGFLGDHQPSYTIFLEAAGAGVDPITGKGELYSPDINTCDFLGTSLDYYFVELPADLKILAGQEPDWLQKEDSSSGACLKYLHDNARLKDYDGDGEYEIVYRNNLIGIELQRALGWVDIDGDGVAEIIDSDPYGMTRDCSCSDWLGQNCGQDNCAQNEKLFIRDCEDDCDIETECRTDPVCTSNKPSTIKNLQNQIADLMEKINKLIKDYRLNNN